MIKFNYNILPSVTHIISIAITEDQAFKALKSTCRNRIRRGEKNNLIIDITEDPSIVNQFYEQYKEVWGKQGLVIPFSKERVISLFNNLIQQEKLLAIRVLLDKKVIATGLFPHDENAIYFWGAASWMEFQKYYPNEILHWSVIKFAVRNNIKVYNMCGGHSQFKNKFGAIL